MRGSIACLLSPTFCFFHLPGSTKGRSSTDGKLGRLRGENLELNLSLGEV